MHTLANVDLTISVGMLFCRGANQPAQQSARLTARGLYLGLLLLPRQLLPRVLLPIRPRTELAVRCCFRLPAGVVGMSAVRAASTITPL